MDCRLGLTPLTDGFMQVSLTGVDWHGDMQLGSTHLNDVIQTLQQS